MIHESIMTQQQFKLINKVWNYSDIELLHRRAYIMGKVIIKKNKEIFIESNYNITKKELNELDIIGSIISIEFTRNVFIYNECNKNPYVDGQWFEYIRQILFLML